VRFDEETLRRLRRAIMARGQKLATMLSEVLAGKEPPALSLVDGKPGMRPEEKLRYALDQIEARRKLIDAGDDRYGRCDICGEDLGLPALEELPWADRCAAHAKL
jgi:RNA polymerase-binding transcription factor DksA